MAKPVSLAAFAEVTPVRKPGKPCWACHIKETSEINENRRKGVAIPVIRQWLIEVCGYEPGICTEQRLSHHFSNSRHHE